MAQAPKFYYQMIHVVDAGKTCNEKFFEGPLPQIGDAVEMVLVAVGDDGALVFQLRTKAKT